MLLTPTQVAQKLGVTRQTVYLWMKAGLKHQKSYRGLRQRIHIKEEDLQKFLNSKRKR